MGSVKTPGDGNQPHSTEWQKDAFLHFIFLTFPSEHPKGVAQP